MLSVQATRDLALKLWKVSVVQALSASTSAAVTFNITGILAVHLKHSKECSEYLHKALS